MNKIIQGLNIFFILLLILLLIPLPVWDVDNWQTMCISMVGVFIAFKALIKWKEMEIVKAKTKVINDLCVNLQKMLYLARTMGHSCAHIDNFLKTKDLSLDDINDDFLFFLKNHHLYVPNNILDYNNLTTSYDETLDKIHGSLILTSVYFDRDTYEEIQECVDNLVTVIASVHSAYYILTYSINPGGVSVAKFKEAYAILTNSLNGRGIDINPSYYFSVCIDKVRDILHNMYK